MKILLLPVLLFVSAMLQAQTAKEIVAEFAAINDTLLKVDCRSNKGDVISKRGMNIFLAYKVATYFSGTDDLSLYKNAVTFNTSNGTFAILHNMRQPIAADVPVKSSLLIGAKANVLNSFACAAINKHFINDFGMLVKQVWMGKTTTTFDNCTLQTNTMAAHRVAIFYAIEKEISQKSIEFEDDLQAIKERELPAQNIDSAKQLLRRSFYQHLQEEYRWKFAAFQAQMLDETSSYRTVKTSWTSIGVYLPVLEEKFFVAAALNQQFRSEHGYPFQFLVTHTRFWESTHFGRLFLKFNSCLFVNNSYHTMQLETISSEEYLSRGGVDASGLNQQNSKELLIGPYSNFITPFLNLNFIYFPHDSHIGLSGSIEKNFGSYNASNGRIGVPVVLIDKEGNAAFSFEFQVRFFDLSNQIQPAIKIGDKVSIGFSLGIPFSKIVY